MPPYRALLLRTSTESEPSPQGCLPAFHTKTASGTDLRAVPSLILGFVHEPEEGSCLSRCSIVPVEVVRRQPCLASTAGRPPRNKGLRYPADRPKIEEIVAVMRAAGDRDTVGGSAG
jgi:hypothetical protein